VPIPLAGPHIAVEDLVPLIPASAYRAVTVGAQTYWCFTLVVRVTLAACLPRSLGANLHPRAGCGTLP